MKKIYLSLVVVSTFVSFFAKAGDIYIAPSVSMSQVNTQYKKVNEAQTTRLQNNEVNQNNAGFSLDLGYRGNFGKFFIGPEFFYNYYNTQAEFQNANNPRLPNASVKINDVNGIALNMGYKFTPKFAMYSRYGVGSARADVNWYNFQNTESTSIKASSTSLQNFAIGSLYYLNNNSAIKFSYERTSFAIKGVSNAPCRGFCILGGDTPTGEARFNVVINAINLGMLFQF